MSLDDRDGVIWMDGEFVPWRDAKVHVLTHTLHYGMGVFEGVRAYKAEQGTCIFRLKEHTDRLFRSAHIMNMPVPFDKDTINEAQRAAVRENNLETAYLRPMFFYGSEGLGLRADNLKVHAMVAAFPCVRQRPTGTILIPCWHYRKRSVVAMMKRCCWIPKVMLPRVVVKTFLLFAMGSFIREN